MDEEGQSGFGDGGQGALQLLAVDHGEAVAAGVDEEALEAGNAGAGEREQVGLVVGDAASPGGPVDRGTGRQRLRA